MKKQIIILLISVITINCFAWGPTGHHIVAEIAQHYMKKNVIDSVNKYLGNMTLEDAATWMDDMRKDKSYDYMKPWHYINIAKDKTYVKTTNENVVNKLTSVIDELNNHTKHTKEEINMSLKILFHLIGDIQMPLHAGYPDDKGGLEIKVDFLGAQESLHWVWDTKIIEQQKITKETILKLAETFSEAEKKEMSKIDIPSWIGESRAMLQSVYDYDDNKIGYDYILRQAPVIQKQLLKGGLRLAEVLNTAFSK
jgi:hypothetical protein